MDPSVQSAIVSAIGVLSTSAAVVIVAFINNRKERDKAATAGVEAGLDDQNVLENMLSLIEENRRKELTIESLRKKNRELSAEIKTLRALLRAQEREA